MLQYIKNAGLLGVAAMRALNTVFDASQGREYIGLLANKCKQPNNFGAVNKQAGGDILMEAMSDMRNFRMVYGNWYTDTTGEKATGGIMSLTVAIEYPLGQPAADRTLVRWGGAATAQIADKTTAESDPVKLFVPKGAKFRVHCFQTNPAGIVFAGTSTMPFSSIIGDDRFQFAANGLTDLTRSGRYAAPGATQRFAFPPLGIVGATRAPSVAITGDSRNEGYRDYLGDAFQRRGLSERAVGVAFAATNLAQGGEGVQTFLTVAGDLRRAFVNKYCTHVISNYATNDIYLNNRTEAQVKADLATFWSGFPGKSIFHQTMPPNNNSNQIPTSLTSAGTTATAVLPLAAARALKPGQPLTITGAVPAGYNGEVTVTAVNTATGAITYTLLAGATDLTAATTVGLFSDNWASLEFQNPSSKDPTRIAINDWLRVTTAITRVIDVADVLESSRNSGKWDIRFTQDASLSSTAKFDGLHETSLMCRRVAESGVLSPRFFARV